MAARPRIQAFVDEIASDPRLTAAILEAVGDALPGVIAQLEAAALREPAAPAEAPSTHWARQALKGIDDGKLRS